MSRGELYEHLLRELPPLNGADELRTVDAQALTEYVYPTDRDALEVDGPRYVFSSVEQKHALLARLLKRFARRRPTILWLDDLQWGRDALDFLDYLRLGHVEVGRVFVVATLRSDVLVEELELERRIEAVAEGQARRVMLDRLSVEDNVELLTHMLPINEAMAEGLSERTEGNPLFGLQLLTDWVERGAVRTGSRSRTVWNRASRTTSTRCGSPGSSDSFTASTGRAVRGARSTFRPRGRRRVSDAPGFNAKPVGSCRESTTG